MGLERQQSPEGAKSLRLDGRSRVAAFMLTLAHTGIDFETAVVDRIINELADAADVYHASADDVQSALEWHEPTLGLESTYNG